MIPRIVVVTGDGNRLSVLLQTLNGAGYMASGACTFAEGRELLKLDSTDLVIADERLGSFNGLHLIVSARASDPRLKAIVMSHARDAALEHDAELLNVGVLVQPTEPSAWLSSISSVLGGPQEFIH